MGLLWVARHLQLDVEVALKFMMPQHVDSPVARARFEREAKASAQLRSPHVVHVYDYGIEGDTPYLAMELLEGEDLAARLRRKGRLTPAEMLGIVGQVCKALRRAHEVGLIHRDLKPANVFLARQGEEIVKILDFGVAKAIGTGLVADATKTGTLIGSPHYMSPEQVRRSKAIDWRSDLWSVGVIIFQCLTGQLPFPGEELGDVLVEICTGDIPVASHVAPELWPELDRFLERALRREPAERFQSADELAEAFAAAVERAALRGSSSSLTPGGAQVAGGAPIPGGTPIPGGAQVAGGAPIPGGTPIPGGAGGTVLVDGPPVAGASLIPGGAPIAGTSLVPDSAPVAGASLIPGGAPVAGAPTAGGLSARGSSPVVSGAPAAGGTVVAEGALFPAEGLAPGGTLEAVGDALPPSPPDRRATARTLLAVVAAALTLGAGIAGVVLLRTPASDAPAAVSSPGPAEPAAPPPSTAEPATPSPSTVEPATPSSLAQDAPPSPSASASAPAPAASSAAPGATAAASAAPSQAQGAVKSAVKPAKPAAQPARRPPPAAPTNKGASERDPTFGF